MFEEARQRYGENSDSLTPEEHLSVQDFLETTSGTDPERFKKAADFLGDLRSRARQRIDQEKAREREKLEAMTALAQPRPPEVRIYCPDHNIVAIKAQIQSRLHQINQELNSIPKLEPWHCGLAFLLLGISFIANLYCFSTIVGDVIPQGVVMALAALITLGEYVAPTALFAILDYKGTRLARAAVIIGSIMVMLGLLLVFMGRGEVLSSGALNGVKGFTIR